MNPEQLAEQTAKLIEELKEGAAEQIADLMIETYATVQKLRPVRPRMFLKEVAKQLDLEQPLAPQVAQIGQRLKDDFPNLRKGGTAV